MLHQPGILRVLILRFSPDPNMSKEIHCNTELDSLQHRASASLDIHHLQGIYLTKSLYPFLDSGVGCVTVSPTIIAESSQEQD